MMTGLVFILMLVVALLGLYLLSDYTGYDKKQGTDDGTSSAYDDHHDDGSWYHDDRNGTTNSSGGGSGKYDEQPIIQTGGGGGWGYDEGIKSAVFAKLVDAETNKIIPVDGVRFELYGTDRFHKQNGALQVLNTYYPDKISYKEYETTEDGTFYLPEKIYQGSYYFHSLSAPKGYDPAPNTAFDIDRLYDWPEPYTVQLKVTPCKNVIRIQMNDADTDEPIKGGSFRIIAAEDITTLDGTIRYKKGQEVGGITCNEKGYGQSPELYLGKYTVRQAEIPAYYVGMEQPLSVDVEQKTESETEIQQIDADRTTVTIQVTDELYDNQKLEGAAFEVLDEQTGDIQTVTTDASGRITLNELDKNTTYHITQTQVVGSYQPDDTTYAVHVSKDGRIEKKSKAKIKITNRLLRVSIHAVDAVIRGDTEQIKLSLYDENNKRIKSWTSSGTGESFTDLQPGTYYVVRGSNTNKKYTFTVRDTKDMQNWNISVFTGRSAVALVILLLLVGGVVFLLTLLGKQMKKLHENRKRKREAAKAQEAEKQTDEKK